MKLTTDFEKNEWKEEHGLKTWRIQNTLLVPGCSEKDCEKLSEIAQILKLSYLQLNLKILHAPRQVVNIITYSTRGSLSMAMICRQNNLKQKIVDSISILNLAWSLEVNSNADEKKWNWWVTGCFWVRC